ncbi:MAG: urease accessory protein UreF [Neomegalonema sp.]|nr:urease accessory protein UreF [Neomegalonema sp.]
MTDPAADLALAKLHAWLSPSFPIGAFSYSHGLEAMVASGSVRDGDALAAWLRDILERGAGRTDAILLAHAYRAQQQGDGEAFDALAALALALSPSAERRLENEAQGTAFAAAIAAGWTDPAPKERLPEAGAKAYPMADPETDAMAYPIALARAAADHACPLPQTLRLYLQAFASNLISAGIRLIPLGQSEGQRRLAALLPILEAVAIEAEAAPLEALGGCSFAADIAAMQHETQYTRLFRT